MAQAADFFVSYTSADRAWAEWIAWQLEAEGYQVVVQAWDFGPGRDWVHEMQQATTTAERVVAVLSAAYFESGHGEAEWRVFYADDPSGKQGRLLPVRVGPIEPPGLLKTRVYVDLVDQDAARARTMLLAAARGARGKPAEEPEFPGGRQDALSATEQPRFPGQLPPVWNVPLHPNPFFTGRQPLLAEMHARLLAPEATVRRLALTGLGGVGKSQLAAEYAYRQRADYDLVWWVRSEQPTTLLGDYAALAGQPSLAGDLWLGEDAPQETVVEAVRVWLERRHRCLLVLDNVEDPRTVIGLLPRSATGHVLMTSRAEAGWEPLADPLPVEVLVPLDAAALLLARTKETGPEAEAAAASLADKLGGLPLALEQAGAYITEAGVATLPDYTELFATQASALLKRGQPLGYQHTVATTWSLALQRLRDTNSAAVDLLILASFLASDDLPQPLLATHYNQLPQSLAAVATNRLALADAVAALRRFSLIRVVGDGLFTHQLVQTVVRAALDAEAEHTWAACAVRLLRVGFHDSGRMDNWAECERLLPHVLSVVEHGQRLEVEPEAWRWLLSHAALYVFDRGQYQQAVSLHQRVMSAYQQVFGKTHPATLASIGNLGLARQATGDLQGAFDLYEQVRTINEELGDRAGMANSYHLLGNVAQLRDDYDQALDWYRQSLAIEEELGDRASMATSYHQLGRIAHKRGDYDQALDWYRQSLAIEEELGDRASMATSYHQLGRIAHKRGDYDQALDWYRQSLAIEEELGDRAGMARSYHQLGMVAHKRGEHDRALDWYRQSLAISEELGNRAGMAATISQIGVLLTETGNPTEGLSWNLRSLGIRAELRLPELSIDLRWLQRQQGLLGPQRFQLLLRQELGDDDSQTVMELLQQLSDSE